MNCEQALTERHGLTDLLCCEKFLCGVYNAYCNETATPTLRACMLSLLQEQHTMQGEVFGLMSSKGYYPVEMAEETKVTQAKQRFMQTVSV